ncbi:MAG: THUMP domain-containing protein [Spirulinaceae cyanobacterium]
MTQYFATVARGLESIAAQELAELGAEDICPDFTGVHFSGDRTLLYRVNLWARTIFRVLVPIREFPCRDAEMLYEEVQKVPWSDYLEPDNTLAVACTGKNRQLNHSHFTALQVKNAIVDLQREETGERSTVELNAPDLQLNIHIHKNRGILSLDSTGESLHRRGYRSAMGLAPLKETLAAALLIMSEWEPSLPFLDPLCGSGTLTLEAALKGLNVAPGLHRQRFGFQSWLDFDASLWSKLRTEAENVVLPQLPAPIYGSDHNSEILEQARSNARHCNLQEQIEFAVTELAELTAPAEKGIILCNPPYGIRVGEEEELEALYKLLGDVFKQRFKGWTAYVLTGSKELGKKIGLKASRRIPVNNGSLPCTLLKYELY